MFNQKLQPNVRAVKKCIEQNGAFQKEQIENFYGAQGVPRNSKVQNEGIEDSFYFPNMVIEESNHNPLKNQKTDSSQKMFSKHYTQLSPIAEDGQPTLNLNDDLRQSLFKENQDQKKEVEKNKIFLPPDIEFERILADEHDEEVLKESEQKSIENLRKFNPDETQQKNQVSEDEIREKIQKEFESILEKQLNEQKIKQELESNLNLEKQKKEQEKKFQQQELRIQLAETKKTEEQKQREKLEKELELIKLKEQQTISLIKEEHQRIIKASQDLFQQETLQLTNSKDQQISDLKDYFQGQLNQKDQQIIDLKKQYNQVIDNHKVEIQKLVNKQVNENHALISDRKGEEKKLLAQIEELKIQNRQQIKSIEEQNQTERQALIDKFIKLEQDRSSLAESKIKSLQQQQKEEKDQLIKQMDQQQKSTKTQSGKILSDLQNEIKKLQQTSWQKEQTMEIEFKTEIQKLELIIENQQNAIQNQANKIDQIKQDKLLFEMQTKIEFQKESNNFEERIKQKDQENQQLIEEINSLQNQIDLLQNQLYHLQQTKDKEEFDHYLVKDQSLEQLLDQDKTSVPFVLNQDQISYEQRDHDLGRNDDNFFKNSEEINERNNDLFQKKVCYQLACEQLNQELLERIISEQIKEITKNEIKVANIEKQEKEKNQKQFEVAVSLYFGQLIESFASKEIEVIIEKEILIAKEKQLTDQAIDSLVTQLIQQEVKTQTKQTISQELYDQKKQKELEIQLEIKQKQLLKEKERQLTAQALDSFLKQFMQNQIEIQLNEIVDNELEHYKNQFILEQSTTLLNNQLIEDFTIKFLQNIIIDEIDDQKQLAIVQKRERKGRNTRKQQANHQTEKSSKQMSSNLSSKDISPTDLQIPQQEQTAKQPVINDFFRQQILQAEAEIEAIRKMQELEAEKLKLIELKNQVARNEEVKQVVKDEVISNFNESMPQMDDNTSQKSIKTCQNYKTLAFDDNYQRLKLTAQHSAEDFLQTSIPSQNQNFLEQIEPMPSIFDVQSQQIEDQSNQQRGDYTEEQYHLMAQQFFLIPPIKFRARRGVVLEEIIASTIQTTKSNLPIIYIRGTLYLVGTQKCICEVKNKTVLLRVQGNSQAVPEELSTKQSSNFSRRFTEGGQLQNQRGLHQRLDNYLQENEQKMRIEFCKMMITHHMNLDQVCEQLISDKMFKQKFQSFGNTPSYAEFQGINLYNQYKKDQSPLKGSFNNKRQTLPDQKKQNFTMNATPKVSSIDLASAIKQKQTGIVKVSQINLDRSTEEQPKSNRRDGSISLNQIGNQISRSQGREVVKNQIYAPNDQIDFRTINRLGGNWKDLNKQNGIDQNVVQMGYLDALNKNINKGSRQGMTRYAQEESEY